MVSPKKEEQNKDIQGSNKNEKTTKEFLDDQTQQIKNTTSTISDTTTNNINNNVNQNQEANQANLGQSINTANRYQQETINTTQSIFNNYIELQKNIANTFQSVFSRFLDNTSKSYWNNFQYSQRDTDAYKNTNQTIADNTINYTQRVNNFALTSTESFNKSIDIAQKYYNESVQNYFDFVNKIGRSYSNQ